jgi:ABC-2 type transport system ATP-binding protein
VLGFLGPNGAGKTSTMRVITGYMPPSEGKVTVAGYDVFTHPIEAKSRTGYLPETPPLYPDMTVREYLHFAARIKMGAMKKSERTMRVEHVMKKTHVDDMANRQCGKLSKGYRQRVGLAQALIHEPEVLVLDEPTAGLDPKQITETRELIRGLGGEHTVILSTHILPEVAQTCGRVVIINKGRVVAVDTPDNLTRPAGRSSRRIRRVRDRGRAQPRRAHGRGARGRARGLGPPRTAADAAQPRRDLPPAHHAGFRPARHAACPGLDHHRYAGGPAWVAVFATSRPSPARNSAATSGRRSPGC